jgi:hypothetical protein
MSLLDALFRERLLLPFLRAAAIGLLTVALTLAVSAQRVRWPAWLRRYARVTLHERRLAALLFGAMAAVASAGLLGMRPPASPVELMDDELDPAPALPTRCPLARDDACRYAHALEEAASARWQRVPFAPEEAPRALVQMAEAELCYGALDRAARLRAAGKRRSYEAELARRFQRARLILHVALRERRLARARQQIAALTSLLTGAAAPESRRYLAQLQQLDRAYAAELVEQERTDNASGARGVHSAESIRAHPARSLTMQSGGTP